MSLMFFNATAFNWNIGSWNTASVTNMSYMFYQATAFDGDISSWNTAAVTSIGSMFMMLQHSIKIYQVGVSQILLNQLLLQ